MTCWLWSAALGERPNPTFNGWRMETTSSPATSTSNTNCLMELASWSFNGRSRRRILERTLARLSATDAVTASVTMSNSKDQLKISSTAFIAIIIAIHWSRSLKQVSPTTPSRLVAASRFSSKQRPTAKPSGSVIDGSSTISRQSATSSTTEMDSSPAWLIMRQWMSRQSTCARLPIHTAHHSRHHTLTSSIRIQSAKARNRRLSSPDHKLKLKSEPAIRSQCLSEFKESQNREVSWWCNLRADINFFLLSIAALQFNGSKAQEKSPTRAARLKKCSTITSDSRLRNRRKVTVEFTS